MATRLSAEEEIKQLEAQLAAQQARKAAAEALLNKQTPKAATPPVAESPKPVEKPKPVREPRAEKPKPVREPRVEKPKPVREPRAEKPKPAEKPTPAAKPRASAKAEPAPVTKVKLVRLKDGTFVEATEDTLSSQKVSSPPAPAPRAAKPAVAKKERKAPVIREKRERTAAASGQGLSLSLPKFDLSRPSLPSDIKVPELTKDNVKAALTSKGALGLYAGAALGLGPAAALVALRIKLIDRKLADF